MQGIGCAIPRNVSTSYQRFTMDTADNSSPGSNLQRFRSHTSAAWPPRARYEMVFGSCQSPYGMPTSRYTIAFLHNNPGHDE